MGFWYLSVKQWGRFMPHVIFHPFFFQFHFICVCHLVCHVMFMLFTCLHKFRMEEIANIPICLKWSIMFGSRVQAWLGYHIWTLKTHSKDSEIHLFLHFPMTCLIFHLFFLMSDEIILFQILYKPLKFLLFSIMEVIIINFI